MEKKKTTYGMDDVDLIRDLLKIERIFLKEKRAQKSVGHFYEYDYDHVPA